MDELLTAAPTIISAIAAIVSAGFAWAIWLVYKGQWRTMEEQAQYMRDGLAETRKAADATGVSAEAARVSAGVAVAVAEQADRPWLNVKVHMSAKLAISSTKGAWIEVRLVIANVGHSAAQYTQIIVGAMIDRHDIQGQAEVKRIVDAAARSTMGEVVLPGDTLEQTFVLGIPTQDIEATWAASPHLMDLPLRNAASIQSCSAASDTPTASPCTAQSSRRDGTPLRLATTSRESILMLLMTDTFR